MPKQSQKGNIFLILVLTFVAAVIVGGMAVYKTLTNPTSTSTLPIPTSSTILSQPTTPSVKGISIVRGWLDRIMDVFR